MKEVLRLPELHRLAHLGLLADASYLIKFGTDVDGLSKDGSTPLHIACLAVQEKMVELLLNQGADPLKPNGEGDVSIHIAARVGSIPILKLLMKRQVPLEVENQLKLTPLQVAAKAGQTKAVQFLISAGAKVWARSRSSGLGCLELAATTGCEATTRHLLNAGAPLGRALHIAAAAGHTAVVALLLDNGLDVNAPDHNEDTPLHLAVIGGHLATIDLLASRGANLNQKGCDGARPVNLARSSRILEWFQDHGVKGLLSSAATDEERWVCWTRRWSTGRQMEATSPEPWTPCLRAKTSWRRYSPSSLSRLRNDESEWTLPTGVREHGRCSR
ncbi:ankyrin repeat and protein kinase domain-containing protein 1 isoform X2 [Halyomorpha halys]|uniref:ankyrin repeat and protein kinase domain-containing protein 1 isoform X2 n=1 Tax=Halyomorpha halys TaxID=286706 RepID=UPI0006D4C93D|nr:ankyrin-1-like isoform X2 [Halyomorpha halys]